MSNTTKVFWIIVVIAVIAGAVWYATRSDSATVMSELGTDTVSSTSGPSTLPTGTDTSNSALDQDLSSIDSQLSGLNADTANASASLNDQQVTQSSL